MMADLLRDRDALAVDEDRRLASYATSSSEATRRHALNEEGRQFNYRLAFQRDRDRVLHSRAFRRLKHKTQVFVPHLADHARTRLTHTLEVAQIARTIARALALNEDLVEAIALGHDLGHTAFGHTGEAVLAEILQGTVQEVPLPEEIVARAGTFKHNYQSVRVVDLLERRYAHPGLNLSDQVREGILKHTGWSEDFAFPLPDPDGLHLGEPCHLEGQVVAVADEIAQQTHDLEDGLRAGSVQLEAVEELEVARQIVARLGAGYTGERHRWLRQNLLIRALVHLLVTDVLRTAADHLQRLLEERGIDRRSDWLPHARELPNAAVWFSDAVAPLFAELKAFIYRFIINHPQVNRQDWRARKVVVGLARAFWVNPLNLPSYVLLRAKQELGFPYLRDLPRRSVAAEVSGRYHTSADWIRLVVDHVAGMSDRFALEEYQSLEHPSPSSPSVGDLI